MADRRYGAARSQLTRLASWWSAGGEIDYLLGSCEQAAGRPKDALAAWNRVPEHSPFSAKAAFQRGTLAMKLGQLAEAESSFLRTLRETGNQAVEVRRHLIALFWMEGRNDEVEALVEASWRQMSQPDWPRPDDATETIRNYIETKTGAVAVEEMTAVLTHAGKQAPDDDRVWLGRANLAVRNGHWDEAASWLEACLRRRLTIPPFGTPNSIGRGRTTVLTWCGRRSAISPSTGLHLGAWMHSGPGSLGIGGTSRRRNGRWSD